MRIRAEPVQDKFKRKRMRGDAANCKHHSCEKQTTHYSEICADHRGVKCKTCGLEYLVSRVSHPEYCHDCLMKYRREKL